MIFGTNVAWNYTTPDALFHGNIRLNYWKHWLILGVLCELLHNYILSTVFP